ncbi:hypothetical protein DCAR_0416459 [Daucus carota subsp. sativus]|uniref:RING-type domain-containing protein n=1 Tax=Daucus carota subsp. sativus TaxID=79200 RepID=A0AAF0X023_DAUCS|nr:hypothetical protein DCAR_0416459 [Daucus carota subsp. sativus]
MSILPSSNSTDSSASNLQFTNPNSSDNGAQQHLFQFSNSDHAPFQSLHISDHLSVGERHVAGSVAQTAQHSGGSSKKMNEARKLYGKKGYAHHTAGTSFQRPNTGHTGAASPQHRGKYEAMGSAGSQQPSVSTPSSGRKGQMVNGNHLLNFHYDPISRSRSRDSPIPPRKQQKRRPYNKDLFLQANYKFVLLDSGNYAPETMDPDKALHWEDIICVKYSTPLPVHCPICLEDPLCPQITSCGHIFCFPCILRYLAGEDDFKVECSKKCPLCFMVISVKDLYTIYIENVKQYRLGDVIEFMLLTRQKDSFTLALKNKQGMCSVEEVNDSFSKFTFTSDVDLSVREVISELDNWLARADSNLVDDMSMLPYVCAAREQLEQRKANWNEHQAGNGDDMSGNSTGHTSSPLAKNSTVGIVSSSVNDKPTGSGIPSYSLKDGKSTMAQVSDAIGSPEVCDESLSSSFNDDKSVQMQGNDFRDKKENDSYNFYQAVDGQHLILHPINLKCLLHHYGSYDRLPHRIHGKIVQLETVTQSEAMRKRYRYLSHFSLTTTFQLCEIDLSDSLPLDAFSPFIDEIKNREKQRKRVARKEQEEKIKAEVAAATEFLTMPYNFAQPSHDFSPNFSMDDFEALGSSAVVSVSPPVGERPLFSNVTRLGFAAAHDSPALKFEEPSSLTRTDVATNSSPSGTQSFANVISRAKPVESKISETGKRGKKPSRVLLSTAGAMCKNLPVNVCISLMPFEPDEIVWSLALHSPDIHNDQDLSRK